VKLVVSDSGPLIALGTTGRLALLRDLYGEVLLPREVFEEVAGQGADEPGAPEVRAATYLTVAAAPGDPLQVALRSELDAGEAAALSLAKRVGADLVLIDERKGRLVAHRLGFRVRGTVGVLLDAKTAGLVLSVRDALVELRAAGVWMSDSLFEEALRIAGESTAGTD
jgi:predicted nucleic acid-binding protein